MALVTMEFARGGGRTVIEAEFPFVAAAKGDSCTGGDEVRLAGNPGHPMVTYRPETQRKLSALA